MYYQIAGDGAIEYRGALHQPIRPYWRGGQSAANIGMVMFGAIAGRGEGKMIRWVSPILALVTSLALAQPGQAQDKIRLGHNANSARNIGSLPLHILMRQALFAREGLAVELVGLPGTTHMVDALDTGTVEVTGTATPYLIQAALKGSDAVAVIGGPANAVYSLIAKPEIATAAELRGKRVAMSTPADTISLSTRLLLASHGIKDGDYQTKELVGSNARGNCLVTGECDAVPLGQPDDIVLVQKGFRKLGDFARSPPRAAIQRARRAACLGGGAQGHVGAAGARVWRGVQILARSRQSQRGRRPDRRDHRCAGGGRAPNSGALLSSRTAGSCPSRPRSTWRAWPR